MRLRLQATCCGPVHLIISRVSLKYDATECSPGLLSMEWYPSLLVPGRQRMFTSVGEHGMVPLLVPGVFHQLVFPCRYTCSSETHGTILTSVLVLVENVFTPLASLLFLECKLHYGTCILVLKARAEAVLTTILYMPFDVVYYLFLCALLLLCQPGLLSMEWYPSLFLKFFHQLILPCRHTLFSDTWHHPYISICFCGKRYYFPYFLIFMECKQVSPVFVITGSKHIETNANSAKHGPSASCMFYAASLRSRKTISAELSAVITTGACPTGIRKSEQIPTICSLRTFVRISHTSLYWS